MHIPHAHISLDRQPSDKIAAIAQAAALFVDSGCVEEPFRYGLIAREAIGTTYLGHGIAVPHGVAQTERYITQNSLVLIRTAEGGIPWGPQAERVDTVIAVAAKSDAYLPFLRHLTQLIHNPEHLAILKTSQDPQTIIDLLTLPLNAPPAEAQSEPAAHRHILTYPHSEGLHLHPASTLSELAKTLDANVQLHTESGQSAHADNLSEILALGITQGQTFTVSADTPQAINAVVRHLQQPAEAPQAELLPPEARTSAAPAPAKTHKTAWYIAGGIALGLLIYFLTR